MSDPLALLPLAASARGGRVDQLEAQQLAAAGLTLLRRCPPLVRALSGRRAAILLPTTPAYLTALAACEGRGAVLVNPLAAPPEIVHQLGDANAGVVFTIGALAPRLPADVPRVLLDDAPRTAAWEHAGDRRTIDLGTHFGFALEGEQDVPGRDEEAAIVYTSAMAGIPLGAILTHRNLLANARSAVDALGMTADDRALALLPFAHLFGLTVTLVAPMLAGARTITLGRFDAVRAAELLREQAITILVGVPSVFAGLLAVEERSPGALRGLSLQVCICGGAPLAPVIQERWAETTGVELRQGYGLTEAGPVCLFDRPPLPNRIGTLGVAFPDVEVTIRDPNTSTELSRGTEGEICVAGANVSPGYVSGGEHGLARHGRWLHTGDLGTMDDEDFVTFRGVRKAMFTRNGFNIYPREIERVVTAMPGVQSASVHAIPEPLRENDIALHVTGHVRVDDVRRWCEARLARYKVPTVIEAS